MFTTKSKSAQPLTDRPAGPLTKRRTVAVNGLALTWTPDPNFTYHDDKALLLCELAVTGQARLMGYALFDRTGLRPHRLEVMVYTSNEFTGHTVLWSGVLVDEPTLEQVTALVLDKTCAALTYLQGELCPTNRQPNQTAVPPIYSY